MGRGYAGMGGRGFHVIGGRGFQKQVGGAFERTLLPCPRAVLEFQCQAALPALSLLLPPCLQVSQECPAGRGCQPHLLVLAFLETHTTEAECMVSRC